MRGKDFCSSHILILLYVWIYVYHLSISLIPEKKPGFSTSSVHFEVWTVVGSTHSRFPVIVTQISRLGDQLCLSFENGSEILCFQTVGVVNIS